MIYNNRKHQSLSYHNSLEADSYTYVEGKGFAPTPPVITERRLLQWYANGIGFAILFYIIFSFFLPSVIRQLLYTLNPSFSAPTAALQQLTNLISGNLALLLPFLLLTYICQAPFSKVIPFRAFRASITIPSLFIALACSVIGYVASLAVSAFLSLFGVMPVMADFSFPDDALSAFFFVLNITLIAPITEEIVFRGVIMHLLRRFGDCFALLLSSLLFAAVHMNFLQMPNALIMGLVIGYFTLCTGSLWTGVCIHILNNSLVLLLNGVLNSVAEMQQLLILLIVYSLYLIVGIAAFVILLKQHSNLFCFPCSSTLSTERKKYNTFFSSLTMMICLLVLAVITLSNLVAI